jgi:predicted porin
MKKLLLGSSALLTAAALATPAVAEEPIKLTVGGFFKEAYMVVIDDDDEFELGFDRNTDGFFNDAEIHFTGSTVLDNGLEVGARVELEGETDSDQIDEAWVFFSGGFGEVRIGSDDDALANTCVVPPGGTGNFSAFSPNQWGANSAEIGGTTFFGPTVFSSNSVCTGVDARGDAQKLIYITPNFGGFQLTGSYTPNEIAETHGDGAGPHLGMTGHVPLGSRHNLSVYGTYSYEGGDWGLTAGLGGSWEGHTEEGGTDASIEEQDFYQAGVNLSVGNFSFGVVGEYFSDVVNFSTDTTDIDVDVWVVGAGAAYRMDAWTFGLQYSHRETDVDINSNASFDQLQTQQDRVVATVNYAMGPGISIDGEVGYTWVDLDPEFETLVPAAPEGIDDYDAIEFAIGTNITF